jgi:xanthine dehydrogenase YagR molybdenum-binding subunit
MSAQQLPGAPATLLASLLAQDGQAPPAPGKKRVKVTRVVDGHDVEEWIEVDASAGPSWPARETLRLLEHECERVDAPLKVSGAARYPHDQRPAGMLWGKLLLCPQPAARVRKLDLAPALAIEGVRAAIELGAERTRYLGQPIAAVAADTQDLAEDAMRAILVEYEEDGWVVNHAQATAAGAPQVSSRGNVLEQRERGDETQARGELERAAFALEQTYSVPVQHHACLETHGVVVEWKGESAIVHASTQGTFTVLEDAAEALGLPESKVESRVDFMGGGFGGKFSLGVEGEAACKLARATQRSVHLLLDREAEFLMAGNRSGAIQRLHGGVDAQGNLLGLIAHVDKLGGLGQGAHPGQPYIYAARASYLRMRAVHTNTDASRAMRAPGHPQASFAIESLLDELAYGIGLDLVEIRKRNTQDPVYHRQLDRAAAEIGWERHPHRTRPGPLPARGAGPAVGIGFGLATWGGGGSPICRVEVRIGKDGSVLALSGSQDLGTGTRTYLASIPAEVLGLPLAAVEARLGSSQYGPANPSGGSTTVASLAPAVLDAAWNARAKLCAQLAPLLGTQADLLALEGGELVDRGPSGRRLAWAQACALLGAEGISATGEWRAELASSGVHGVQAAEVEVDTDTGALRVKRMVAVQDCGLVLNRLAAKSQMHGGMIQALGYALSEERVIDSWLGLQLNASFEEYKLPCALEIPEMTVILEDDPRGVIGIAEAAIIPGHSAIANALHNACGVRVRELPLSPARVLTEIERLRALPEGERK